MMMSSLLRHGPGIVLLKCQTIDHVGLLNSNPTAKEQNRYKLYVLQKIVTKDH